MKIIGGIELENKNLTKKQVLSIYNLTSYGLNELIKEGLPHYVSGKTIYFPKLNLDTWMARQQNEIDMLKPGVIISNNTLATTFKCSPQGGMRRSHRTNTLILVAKPTNDIYIDTWKNNVLHYTGMGQKGDQTLNGNQNITLYDSSTNKVNVHLFEVHKNNEYTYIGKVYLADKPYQIIEKDLQGNNRLVWKFPLAIIQE